MPIGEQPEINTMLSNTVASSHTWVLSTYDVASQTDNAVSVKYILDFED